MSDVTSTFDLVKNLVNQFINFVPLGIYFFAYFTAIVFNDMRGGLIMLGMFLNDLVGIFYNKYVGLVDKKPACAVFATSEDDVIDVFVNGTGNSPSDKTKVVASLPIPNKDVYIKSSSQLNLFLNFNNPLIWR